MAGAGGVEIADLGSGTGLSAIGFLDRGHRVFSVEPNTQMRVAAEAWLRDRARFVSVAGTAEATTLRDASVDLVISAQAFLGFDVLSAARETRRILRSGGRAAVLWNLRRVSADAFLDGYESLLRAFAVDYGAVAERCADPASLNLYFGQAGYRQHCFDHAQFFDFEGLEGSLVIVLLYATTRPSPTPPHARQRSRSMR